jgi:hypothetical protein
MNEYKVVYWEDDSGETFGITVKSKLQNEINKLAEEGWVVSCSNTTIIPPKNTEKIRISAYALLAREIIPFLLEDAKNQFLKQHAGEVS